MGLRYDVEQLKLGGGGGGVTDHGALTGLSDDDHSQYLNSSRHAVIDAADHGSGSATDGHVLTADGAGGAAWEAAVGASEQLATQKADLVITSNATYQDTSLSLALGTGTYHLEMDWCVTSHSTPGMKVKPAFSGTTTLISLNRLVMTGATGNSSHETTLFEATYTTTGFGIQHWDGILVVSVAGTFTIQAKQTTSSGTAVTFHAGSFLRATKVA